MILILCFIGMLFVFRLDKRIFGPVVITSLITIGLFIGIIVVLIQRIKEINRGEEYDARNY